MERDVNLSRSWCLNINHRYKTIVLMVFMQYLSISLTFIISIIMVPSCHIHVAVFLCFTFKYFYLFSILLFHLFLADYSTHNECQKILNIRSCSPLHMHRLDSTGTIQLHLHISLPCVHWQNYYTCCIFYNTCTSLVNDTLCWWKP